MFWQQIEIRSIIFSALPFVISPTMSTARTARTSAWIVHLTWIVTRAQGASAQTADLTPIVLLTSSAVSANALIVVVSFLLQQGLFHQTIHGSRYTLFSGSDATSTITTPTTTPSSPSYLCPMNDTDFMGSDITIVTNVSSWQECGKSILL